jgi:hypothetical protein
MMARSMDYPKKQAGGIPVEKAGIKELSRPTSVSAGLFHQHKIRGSRRTVQLAAPPGIKPGKGQSTGPRLHRLGLFQASLMASVNGNGDYAARKKESRCLRKGFYRGAGRGFDVTSGAGQESEVKDHGPHLFPHMFRQPFMTGMQQMNQVPTTLYLKEFSGGLQCPRLHVKGPHLPFSSHKTREEQGITPPAAGGVDNTIPGTHDAPEKVVGQIHRPAKTCSPCRRLPWRH